MSRLVHDGITLLQHVLPLDLAPEPAPAAVGIAIVTYDADGAIQYWCGEGCGVSGDGWTRDEVDATTYGSFSAANLARKRVKRLHPSLRITLRNLNSEELS